MSVGVAKAPIPQGKMQRRVPRHSAAVAVDVTILRSGVPDCIPGRALNLGEGGMAAILAGEVRLGDTVGVEFRLPDLPVRLRAKAVVRHQARLRYGLEFRSLSAEQVAMLRCWSDGQRNLAALVKTPPSNHQVTPGLRSARSEEKPSAGWLRPVLWGVLALVMAAGGTAGWWHWHRAWQELEAQLPGRPTSPAAERPLIPAAEMEPLVVHRVDPVYPEAARQARLQGVVLLDTLVGRDGTVLEVRPLSGPSILASAAADAVRWWRFQPYQVNGKPAEVETTVAVEFRP